MIQTQLPREIFTRRREIDIAQSTGSHLSCKNQGVEGCLGSSNRPKQREVERSVRARCPDTKPFHVAVCTASSASEVGVSGGPPSEAPNGSSDTRTCSKTVVVPVSVRGSP